MFNGRLVVGSLKNNNQEIHRIWYKYPNKKELDQSQTNFKMMTMLTNFKKTNFHKFCQL